MNDIANFVDRRLHSPGPVGRACRFTAGPLSITPAFHFVITDDEVTKVTKLTSTGVNQKDTKIWGGVTISWSKALGPKAEE